ncbi:taurine catabolism dioxygenase TauD [Sodiomyces alkalinus F11]|uniref:Taurine catabolism dioxygenase TauD n=1 Tax=Sodiomyces alkalinus (strain CBS 110278 / VKM F-3762 / F11) TaxID=1314773 RepID=A0A3N2Q069_SODAK|nr:taurine catabolism dioxygenase TauD [Sodiomyces alkalinus F11]ROT40076.1 taurine catabolism dioxygenase TauD [Sodiomyces alkalinus F11]
MAYGTTLPPVVAAEVSTFSKEGCSSGAVDFSALPSGFPESITSDAAWTGANYASKPSEFILLLAAVEIEELEEALAHFKGLDLDGGHVTRHSFPLPILSKKLSQVAQDIYSGRGFALIRGLKPENYSVEDLTLLYLGIQVHIADQQGRQDKRGNMLVHIVADDSTAQKAEHHRHSTSAISFHNEEAGDIVSWLTRDTAAKGGKCILASAHTVYNILATARPDMIRTLAGSDWPFSLPRFQCRPILFNHGGKIIMNFGRTPLMGSAAHPRPEHLPALTSRQIEALNAVEALARATQLEIQTQAGDIHFINNFAVLHRREGFVDGPQEKRHLVRMLLRDTQQGWAIPEELRRHWFDAFEREADRAWHLQPMPEGFFPLRINTN